jgi:putative zinc finger protein
MNQANQKMSADDIEALLPWYAAGTLDAREADQVEAALAVDAELTRRLELAREEMAETVLLNESLGVPSPRVMENLFKAIDRERGRSRAPAAGGGLGGWLMDLFTPRAFAFAAGAAVVIVALQAGVIAKLVLQDRVETRSSFETASAPPATRGLEIGSFALVRFAPQASMADVTRFLDTHDAVIVDGPRPGGPGGMYRVRVAHRYVGKEELERLVKEFQSASNLISTAVPTE